MSLESSEDPRRRRLLDDPLLASFLPLVLLGSLAGVFVDRCNFSGGLVVLSRLNILTPAPSETEVEAVA